MSIAPIAKAVTGAITAGCAVAITSLTDNVISPVEWLLIISAAATGFGAVWAVPNREPVDLEAELDA